jgi:hypothetical protein
MEALKKAIRFVRTSRLRLVKRRPRLRAAVGGVLLVWLSSAGPLTAQPPPPGGHMFLPPRAELHFSVDAAVDAATLKADVEAGGRLLMRRRERAGAAQTLALLSPIEHPWKLFWVDPLGPFGEEVKLGAEVTLPAGSWEALAEARAAVDRFGEETYRQWAARSHSRRPFDGAFAFVVIGPPDGRFEAEIAPSGRLVAVTNRMTDRWLGEDFDRLAKNWQAAVREGTRPPEGYWFWNHGEAEPPVFEPHAYHALAAALELLALPVFPDDDPGAAAALGAGGHYRLDLADVAGRARRVLETLAPKTRGRLAAAGSAAADFTVEEASPARLVVAGRTQGAAVGEGGEAATLDFRRRVVYDLDRHFAVSDAVTVVVAAPDGRLEVAVGYEPVAEPDDRRRPPPRGAR